MSLSVFFKTENQIASFNYIKTVSLLFVTPSIIKMKIGWFLQGARALCFCVLTRSKVLDFFKPMRNLNE